MGAREGTDEPDEPGSWARCLGASRHRRGPQAGLARQRRKFSLVSSPQLPTDNNKNAACASSTRACCRLFVVYKSQQKTEQGNPTRIDGGGNEGGTRAMTATRAPRKRKGVEGRRFAYGVSFDRQVPPSLSALSSHQTVTCTHVAANDEGCPYSLHDTTYAQRLTS